MFRKIVREFFRQFVNTREARAPISRSELIGRVIAFAERTHERRLPRERLIFAVDAELRERFLANPRVRVRRGYYRFRNVEPPVASTMPPPILRRVVEEFVPRDLGRDQTGRVETGAAQLFYSGEFGGMDARTLVATNLLSLGPEEYASLFSLQGMAL